MTHEEKTDNWVSVGKMAEEYNWKKTNDAEADHEKLAMKKPFDIDEEMHWADLKRKLDEQPWQIQSTPSRLDLLKIASTLPHGSLDELIATAGKIGEYLREDKP